MKGQELKDKLLRRNELPGETGLSLEALNKFEEAGFLGEGVIRDGVKYYTKETVETIRAMRLCLGRCSDLNEAYEMALQAVALKTVRDEQAGQIADGDHRGTIDPEELKTHPTFEGLLPIDEDLLEEIGRKMTLYGYYESQPILLGKWPGLDDWVVVDGHTRRLAAIKKGIKGVFYVTREFESESVALEHAMSLQSDRRITEDRHIFQFVERYDTVTKRGGNRRGKREKSKPTGVGIETRRSPSARRTGSMMGCNYKKVEKVRKIWRDAPSKIHDAVRNGEMSINKAYNLTVGKEKGGKKAGSSSAEAKAPEVQLTHKNLAALKELEGDLHYHVNTAVTMYIRWLQKKALAEEKKTKEHK